MRVRFLSPLIAVAAAVVLGSPTIAQTVVAQAAPASVCKDGTTSASTGRGTCTGHGGVDAKATEAAKTAAAKPAVAQVMCTDGAMSKGGQGACSGHGGIKTVGAATPVAAPVTVPAPARPTAPAVAPAAKPASVPTATPATVPTATPTAAAKPKTTATHGEDNDATDAMAQCKDGMYSHATTHRGACSKHGGVAKFLKP